MRLLFLRHFIERDLAYLKDKLAPHYELIIPNDFSFDHLKQHIEDADVALGNMIDPLLLESAGRLKLMQVLGAGVERVAIEKLSRAGIIVANSHSNAPYVAEFAMALMFDLFKKVSVHDRLMRGGKLFVPSGKKDDKYFMADTIDGKAIGILGYGHIGRDLVRFLSGFDVRFYVNKRNLPNNSVEGKIHFCPLDRLLEKSDVLFIAAPLTGLTRNMIGSNELSKMKRSAYLINVSRAAIVNKVALYEALKNDIICGAALDVWYEDFSSDSGCVLPSTQYPFHELPNMLLSPHRAACLRDRSPHLDGAIENLVHFKLTGEIRDAVNCSEGY